MIKFAGGYHGHVDGLLAEAGSGLATQGIPASPGVTEAQAADTIVVPWNDPAALAAAARRAGDDLAAVIAEPVPANMGLVPPRRVSSSLLRSTCDEAGALLVLDEVITGFRVARGGAQEPLGVRPGPDRARQGARRRAAARRGGGPAGPAGAARAGGRHLPGRHAVGQPARDGGRARDAARCWTPVPTSGSAAPPSASRRACEQAAAAAGVTVQVPRTTGLLTVFFSDRPVSDYAGARDADDDAFAPFFNAMLDRGVYLPPSPFEAWFPSLAHDDDQLDRTLAAAAEAFEEVARA